MEEETKALTVQIPKKLHTKIKTLASARCMKLKELTIELFEKELVKEGINWREQ